MRSTESSGGRHRSTLKRIPTAFIYEDPHDSGAKLRLHYGDLTDSSNLTRIISEVEPDEIYNLGAQSHVGVKLRDPGIHGECRRAGRVPNLR